MLTTLNEYSQQRAEFQAQEHMCLDGFLRSKLKTVGKVQVDSNSQINRNVACYVKSIRPIGSTELNSHCEIFLSVYF